MKTHLTIEQLEGMRTHELADLLGNFVLLLKRLPDVEFKELTQLTQSTPTSNLVQPLPPPQQSASEQAFTYEELNSKKADELKQIAKSLSLPVSGNKAVLVKRILVKSVGAHSEQYAIQNL